MQCNENSSIKAKDVDEDEDEDEVVVDADAEAEARRFCEKFAKVFLALLHSRCSTRQS